MLIALPTLLSTVNVITDSKTTFLVTSVTKVREPDLNRRPPGYEPSELPNCSIPRLCLGSFSASNRAHNSEDIMSLLTQLPASYYTTFSKNVKRVSRAIFKIGSGGGI